MELALKTLPVSFRNVNAKTTYFRRSFSSLRSALHDSGGMISSSLEESSKTHVENWKHLLFNAVCEPGEIFHCFTFSCFTFRFASDASKSELNLELQSGKLKQIFH